MPENPKQTSLSELLSALKQEKKPKHYEEKDILRDISLKKLPQQKERITESNIDDFEKETLEISSRVIFVLEDSLSKWDALKEKPEDLVQEFEKHRSFHDSLVKWAEKTIRSRAKGEALDFHARVNRLLEFSSICRAHR